MSEWASEEVRNWSVVATGEGKCERAHVSTWQLNTLQLNTYSKSSEFGKFHKQIWKYEEVLHTIRYHVHMWTSIKTAHRHKYSHISAIAMNRIKWKRNENIKIFCREEKKIFFFEEKSGNRKLNTQNNIRHKSITYIVNIHGVFSFIWTLDMCDSIRKRKFPLRFNMQKKRFPNAK